MSVENTAERTVRPTHPGEMLREDFLPDHGLTVSGVAEAFRFTGFPDSIEYTQRFG